ncbi:glycosyltransferase family 25 protein [Flavimaricola marinus]|uniref:Glycosyltransferase family 25 (LPS biosynthesis protein) n=1 Tax=Flavimaricola marinus TaxID=1819565 RepID=A0A238LGW1_9RHOB|nr:glycosyltransferase family 25 protein [Flavimaricola marinus]SMY08130.1 Glycosyltransferase family 25 (LPS biosynthesis protein) [Flavimaricola marinus]
MAQTAHGQALTTIFDHIYIINLPFRTDRRSEIAAQLALVGLSFEHPQVTLFPAIRPDDAGVWPTVGTLGCFMSQLAVLGAALEAGHRSILILEDDLDWSQTFLQTPADTIAAWKDADWDFLHAGLEAAGEGDTQVALKMLTPQDDLMLTHFIGLRGDIIGEARDYLEAITKRPLGSPEGGPMHLDGAYLWYRRAHPDRQTAVGQPRLALQRWSRTDIHDLGWKDSVPVVRQLVRGMRILRNRLRPR